jgi:bacillolysin
MKKIKLGCVFFIILQILSTTGISQSVLLSEISANEGTVSYIKFDTKSNPALLKNSREILRDKLNLNPDDEYRLLLDTTDQLGIHHNYYLQYYRGIPVEKATYAIHARNGIIESINGDFAKINLAEFKNIIDTGLALQSALNFIHAKKYAWEEAEAVPNLRKEKPKAEMVIVKGYMTKPFRYYRTYKFLISAVLPFIQEYVYIDVETGNVVNHENLIAHSNSPATGDSRYSGSIAFTTDSYAGSYRMREVRNGVSITTQDFSTSSNPVDFTDNDNNWTGAEHNNATQNDVALDAHWGAEKVFDYFYSTHGRNSINNQGMPMAGHVHQQGWNGFAGWSRNELFAFFGDNDAIHKPMTALDVVSHEYGHGISQFNQSNPSLAGFSFPGISKAIEEGFSDIWAICVENYAMPSRPIWLVGDQVMVDPSKSCERNAQNPKDPTALQKMAACVGGVNWLDPNADPYSPNMWYQNMGVLTHWFYILSVGKAGVNDIGNTYNVTGIGISNAEKIAYRALTTYVTPQSDYASIRQATITSAIDLFGSNSCDLVAVTNAWYAVGVGAAYQIIPTISGASPICSTGSSYTINNVLCNATITWDVSASSGGTATLSNTSGFSTSIIIPSNFPQSATIILTATISGIASPVTKTIFYGQPGFGASYKNGVSDGNPVAIYFPSQGNNNIFNNVCIGYGFPNVYIDAQPYGTNNVLWSVPSGYATSAFSLQQQNGNRAYFGWNYGGTTPPGYLQASVSNVCGSSSQIFAFKQVNCGTPGGDPCATAKGTNYFTISPNPASDNIKIGIGNKPAPVECNKLKALNTRNGIIFSGVNIYNNLGTLVQSYKRKNSKSATIQIGNLIAGSYLVEIIQGDYSEKQEIIIQK